MRQRAESSSLCIVAGLGQHEQDPPQCQKRTAVQRAETLSQILCDNGILVLLNWIVSVCMCYSHVLAQWVMYLVCAVTEHLYRAGEV